MIAIKQPPFTQMCVTFISNHQTYLKLRLLLAAGSNPHELELMSRSNALLPACAWDNTQSIEAFLRRHMGVSLNGGTPKWMV